jgi:hypothetical protein
MEFITWMNLNMDASQLHGHFEEVDNMDDEGYQMRTQ